MCCKCVAVFVKFNSTRDYLLQNENTVKSSANILYVTDMGLLYLSFMFLLKLCHHFVFCTVCVVHSYRKEKSMDGKVLDSAQAEHGSLLLRQLERMRTAEELTDVVLLAEGFPFPCHKVVLSAFSPYFQVSGSCTDILRVIDPT